MKIALRLIVGATLLVSGCIGGSTASDQNAAGPPAASPLRPADVAADEEFGAVQGVILNDETLPIRGASVDLADTGLLTTTNDGGLFVFREVPPGKHVLRVGALGYESAARSIEVVAGQLLEANFLLQDVPTSEPRIERRNFAGQLECSLGTRYWISACTYPYTAVHGTLKENNVNLSQYGVPADLQDNKHRFNFTVRQGIQTVIGEVLWKSSSAAATRMQLIMLCGDYHYVWDDCLYPPTIDGHSIRYGPGAVGPHPIRKVVDGNVFVTAGKNQGKWDLSKNPSIWVMNYVGLPFENAQVALYQNFNVWDSMFYGEKAPDDYTIVTDN